MEKLFLYILYLLVFLTVFNIIALLIMYIKRHIQESQNYNSIGDIDNDDYG